MVQQQWELKPPHGCCSVTGRALREGEEFYTVLFEEQDSFRRADYSVEAWSGPPAEAYCHFKTRLPVKEKRKRTFVNDEMLVGFFERLADETEPVRIQFRFVIALMLMRKRLLRYVESKIEAGTEVWTMRLASDQSLHRVTNPQLSDDQIEGVSTQLSAILHEDMAQWRTVNDD
ncbi:MAG: hypothetical protein ACE5HE_08920 [Phycisphaerae bacterium]